MQRTANRPLATKRLTDAEGLAFGLALCIASYFILAGLVNLLAAALSLVGIFYYVLIYNIWLISASVFPSSTLSKICARWMTTALLRPLETIPISFNRSVSFRWTSCFSFAIRPSYLYPTT